MSFWKLLLAELNCILCFFRYARVNVFTTDLHIVPLTGSVSFVGVQVYRAKHLLKLVLAILEKWKVK